ncbi:MAG: AarF/UbiB family protein [Burkholderiaceae bacterium]
MSGIGGLFQEARNRIGAGVEWAGDRVEDLGNFIDNRTDGTFLEGAGNAIGGAARWVENATDQPGNPYATDYPDYAEQANTFSRGGHSPEGVPTPNSSVGRIEYANYREQEAARARQAAAVRYEVRSSNTAEISEAYARSSSVLSNPNALPNEIANSYDELNDLVAKERSNQSRGMGSLDSTFLPQMENRLSQLRRRRNDQQDFIQVMAAAATTPGAASQKALNDLTYLATNDPNSTFTYEQRQQLVAANALAGAMPSYEQANNALYWASQNPSRVTPEQVQALEAAKSYADDFERRTGMTSGDMHRVAQLTEAQETLANLPVHTGGLFGREEAGVAAARLNALNTLAQQAQHLLLNPEGVSGEGLLQSARLIMMAQKQHADVVVRLSEDPTNIGGRLAQNTREMSMNVIPLVRNLTMEASENPNVGDRAARVNNVARITIDNLEPLILSGALTQKEAVQQLWDALSVQREALPEAQRLDIAGANAAGRVGEALQTSAEAGATIAVVSTGAGVLPAVAVGTAYKEANDLQTLRMLQDRAELEMAVTGVVSPQTAVAIQSNTSLLGLTIDSEPLTTASLSNAAMNTVFNAGEAGVTAASATAAQSVTGHVASRIQHLSTTAQRSIIGGAAATTNGVTQSVGHTGLTAARLGVDGEMSAEDWRILGDQASNSLATTVSTSVISAIPIVGASGNQWVDFVGDLGQETLGEAVPQMARNAAEGRPLLTGAELAELIAGNLPDGAIGSFATQGPISRLPTHDQTNVQSPQTVPAAQINFPENSEGSEARVGPVSRSDPGNDRDAQVESGSGGGSGSSSGSGSGVPPGGLPPSANNPPPDDGMGDWQGFEQTDGAGQPAFSNLQYGQPSLAEYALPGVDPTGIDASPIDVRELTRERPEARNENDTDLLNNQLFSYAMGHALSRPPGQVPTPANYGGNAESGLFAGIEANTAAELQAQVEARVQTLIAEGRLRPLPGMNVQTGVYEDVQTGRLYRVGSLNTLEIRNHLGVSALLREGEQYSDANLGAAGMNPLGIGGDVDWSKSLYIPSGGGHGSRDGAGTLTSFGYGVLEMARAPGVPVDSANLSPAETVAVRDRLAQILAQYHLLTGNLHNDLHGGNIIVNLEDGQAPEVTLIDFEFARPRPEAHLAEVDRIAKALPDTFERPVGMNLDEYAVAQIRDARRAYNYAVQNLPPPNQTAALYQSNPELYESHMAQFRDRQQALLVNPNDAVDVGPNSAAGAALMPATEPPPDRRQTSQSDSVGQMPQTISQATLRQSEVGDLDFISMPDDLYAGWLTEAEQAAIQNSEAEAARTDAGISPGTSLPDSIDPADFVMQPDAPVIGAFSDVINSGSLADPSDARVNETLATQPSLTEYAMPGIDPARIEVPPISVRDLTRDRPTTDQTTAERSQINKSLFRFATATPLARAPGQVPTPANYGGTAERGLFSNIVANNAGEYREQLIARAEQLVRSGDLIPLARTEHSFVYEDAQSGRLYRVGPMNSDQMRANLGVSGLLAEQQQTTRAILGVSAIEDLGLGADIDWSKSLYIPVARTSAASDAQAIDDTSPFGTEGFGVLEMAKAPGEPLARLELTQAEATVVRDRLAEILAQYHLLTGQVHLDVHPGNILVARREGQDPQVTLIDFGAARRKPEARNWEVDQIGLALRDQWPQGENQTRDELLIQLIRDGREAYNQALMSLQQPDAAAPLYDGLPTLHERHVQQFLLRQQSLLVNANGPVDLPWLSTAVTLPSTPVEPGSQAEQSDGSDIDGPVMPTDIYADWLSLWDLTPPEQSDGLSLLADPDFDPGLLIDPTDYSALPDQNGQDAHAELSSLVPGLSAQRGTIVDENIGSSALTLGNGQLDPMITNVQPGQLSLSETFVSVQPPQGRQALLRVGPSVSFQVGPYGANIKVWYQHQSNGEAQTVRLPDPSDLADTPVTSEADLVNKLADYLLETLPPAIGWSVTGSKSKATFGQGVLGVTGGNYLELGNIDAAVRSGAVLFDPSEQGRQPYTLNTTLDENGEHVMRVPFNITVGIRTGITPTSWIPGSPANVSLGRNHEISVPLSGPIDPNLLNILNHGLNNPLASQIWHDAGQEGVRYAQQINFAIPKTIPGVGAYSLPSGWLNLTDHLVPENRRAQFNWSYYSMGTLGFKVPLSDNDLLPVAGKVGGRFQVVTKPEVYQPVQPGQPALKPEEQGPAFTFVPPADRSSSVALVEVLPEDQSRERIQGQIVPAEDAGLLVFSDGRTIDMTGSILNALNGHPLNESDIPRIVDFLRALDETKPNRNPSANYVLDVVREFTNGQPLRPAGVASLRQAIADAAEQS